MMLFLASLCDGIYYIYQYKNVVCAVIFRSNNYYVLNVYRTERFLE